MSVAPFSMVLGKFYPGSRAVSAYAIDYELLYKKGFRALLFDVDNTLVPHGAPADERSRRLFKRLHDIGFKCLILSNNKEQRVKSFAEGVVYADYIHKAGKPGKRGYEMAMERLGTDRGNTLSIGDQIFTDVWGANRSGIRNILVNPIDRREEIQIILKRIPEKLILWLYEKKRVPARA